MIAKKRINIILIIAVIALWGTVGYRSVKNFFYTKEEFITENKKQNIKSILTQRDTFNLGTLKYDPFLKKSIPKQTKITIHKTNKPQPKKNPETEISFPDVKYFGYIKSGKNPEVLLLKINNKLCRIHKGENKDGILIKKIYEDSIRISFNKTLRTIIKVKQTDNKLLTRINQP
jgi:hypothetical protein